MIDHYVKDGLNDPDEPFSSLMEREQREASEVQRRGWSPCSMTSAQWDELRDWSMKTDKIDMSWGCVQISTEVKHITEAE